jgi:hypothetical protein
MADFTFFSLSLLPTENLQNHFRLEFLVSNFAFRTNFASKERTVPQGWMLVTCSKPERKKGRTKNRYVCMGNQKKKEDCEHKMLKSGFAFWRNYLAPLEVDNPSSVLLFLLHKTLDCNSRTAWLICWCSVCIFAQLLWPALWCRHMNLLELLVF